MGTHIDAVWAQASGGPRRPAARRLADVAARHCFELAGRKPCDIDMLINVGMYREDSMGEPALAALIQQDIASGGSRAAAGGDRSGTFSFDLLNGACAPITAIQIESGLLKSGVIRHGAVVSSDVQPDTAKGNVVLQPACGALLLSWRPDLPGFTDFGAETFPEYQDLFASGLVWRGRRGFRVPPQGTGRNRMVITVRPGYHERLADCAEEAARRFLLRVGLGVADIDLLVPAPASPEFVDPLRARLDIPGDRVAFTPEDLAGSYTTGLIAALQAAVRSGRLDEARTVLLLAAGPGVTVALALYRKTAP
jgi:3-oxoacyl-[acyl-carrier-protein] synthase III